MTKGAASDAVTVRVPMTSANLGVGFDVLGIALDMSASFSFEPSDELVVTGVEERLCGPDNLVWTSYLAGCRELGVEGRALHIHEDSPIPGAGGLGSSSSCVVAGIAASQALAGLDLDRDFTVSLATRIEGHPDNVAPAVMGGLVSSFVDDEGTSTTRWVIAPNLRFVCMAPPYRVLTSDARRALPSMVPMSSVSWQVGRCLAMVSALASGDPARIGACCEDRIHEPYRSPLIPDYATLRELSLESGACAFLISGSGATMLAICDGDVSADALCDTVRSEMPQIWVRKTRASEQGVTVTRGSIS